MREFKWIEWNLEKIDAHALSAKEVEAAFDRVFSLKRRRDGSYEMFDWMTTPNIDQRSAERRALDEQIANESPLAPPPLPADAPSSPVEHHLESQQRRPVAIAGVVEKGVVRPLDPNVTLPEHARVIIVATEQI